MVNNFINFPSQLDDFGWGRWNVFKKDYLELAAKNTKRYHADVFTDYENIKNYINKNVVEKSDNFFFLVSCHDYGSDFLSKDTYNEDKEYFRSVISRITAHSGQFILVCFSHEVVVWEIYDNEKITDWSFFLADKKSEATNISISKSI
jgi:hypothetical protein